MRTITLSGWGQPHDALSILAPDAVHCDYARHHDVESALTDIAQQAHGCDTLIGWSLGGQLAVRAIAAGMFRPRFCVLIATPFQFVATQKNALGMKRDLYEKFRDNYERNPARTLNKAWELVIKGDDNADEIRAHLGEHSKEQMLAKDWLRWLDLLDGFSCAELDFKNFPPTLLIHGNEDAVVDSAQSQAFAEIMPDAELITFADCGHAPHWHDTKAVKTAIAEHAYV